MTQTDVFTPAVLLEIYRKALYIRCADEGVRAQIRSGNLMIGMHPPTGQEIIAAATGSLLNKEDYIVTIYRGLHDQLAKGMPFNRIVAEYFGRETGACKGKGGPMHITDPDHGVMMTTGVVGSGMPVANGLAWGSQIKGDGRVTVTNFGDGASNIGAFHESLNMAALWKLPVIFLCQNNGYGESTTYADATASETVAERAAAYGKNLVGVRVNGNDPEAMWTHMRDAIARARAGDGPTLFEATTYRFSGHYFGDPCQYMPKDELEAAMAKDPVAQTRQAVIDAGAATAEELDALKARYEAEVEAAIQFAKDSPMTALSEVATDVYGVEQ